MQSAILGAGVVYLLLFCVFMLAFCVMWVVLLVRAAISERWTKPQKVLWVLGILFVPPLAIVYALMERSVWWRSYAIVNLVLAAPLLAAAMFGDHAKIRAAAHAPAATSESAAAAEPAESTPAMSPAAPLAGPPDAATEERVKQLGDRIDILGKAHQDGLEGLSYAAATMQLMAWDMQLKAGKINGEQIAPHLDSLENYISDDVLTSEEITAWINELKAAGLVKAKE